MKSIFYSCILLISITIGSFQKGFTQALPTQIINKIDSIFAQWNTNQSPGAVIGIVHHGKLLFEKAYGMADIEKDKKLTPQHSFWVASVSKQFTAMSIALLAEQGKLSLEDDIRKHLPQIPFMGDTIQIKHLIHHTSGLRDGFTLVGMRFKGEKHYTNSNVIQALSRQQTLNFRPGEKYEYNNGGYVLLAEIVAKVSGEPFAVFAHKNIFQPLGMEHTSFDGKITNDRAKLAQGYSVKYKKDGPHYQKGHFKGNTTGSSGLITTLEDLYKWDQNFYYNRLGKANPDLIKQLTTTGKLNDGSKIAYAFGLEVEVYKGQQAITHSGADKGYKAEIVRFPDEQLTLICLSNADNLYSLTYSLLKVGEWRLPAAFQKEAEVNNIDFKETDPVKAEHQTGYYLNKTNFADLRVITFKDHTLHAARSIHGYQQPLLPFTHKKYVNKGSGEYSYEFVTSEDGQTKQINYRERANSYTLESIQTTNLRKDQLKPYRGKYYSPELNHSYHLSIRKGKLSLRIFYLFHIPFQALEGNIFLADLMGNNSLLFEIERSGKVTGFKFSREGVHQLNFIKIN